MCQTYRYTSCLNYRKITTIRREKDPSFRLFVWVSTSHPSFQPVPLNQISLSRTTWSDLEPPRLRGIRRYRFLLYLLQGLLAPLRGFLRT